MAKRGYKLQEFVAHAGNVNCLSIGKKNFRVFVTGGDDQKVNLWSIGKPTPLTSLCGHTSPIESLAFDSAEVLVVAGSSSGAIKLWDLEETKMVRTLTGHRSYCTAVEFHPFGEFFASGSMDTNLKIWDIRKKGCIHTYKGHTRGISNIRFTPDGRWVVSGGLDNTVKVWDLTAGKLLNDFKFHDGHIRSLDFHPFEFLLATGSADKTVKFWDLETFEMIGSTRREAAGVRSIAFHPDGKTLFCGLDDSLKVFSWEPVICHDSIDMGWSMLGDLCVHDEKLLGGAYYENSVAVWVADISLIQPYGAGLQSEKQINSEQKHDVRESPLNQEEGYTNNKPNLQYTRPDVESDEIKNVYVDSVTPVTLRKVGPIDSSEKNQSSNSKEISTMGTRKQGSAAKTDMPAKHKSTIVTCDGAEGKDSVHSRREQNQSFVVPAIVTRDSSDGKGSVVSRREQNQSFIVPDGKDSVLPRRERNQSFVVPAIVTRDNSDGKGSVLSRREQNQSFAVTRGDSDRKDLVHSRRESIGSAKIVNGFSTKPPHMRRLSHNRFDMERMSMSLDFDAEKKDSSFCSRIATDDNTNESSDEKQSVTKDSSFHSRITSDDNANESSGEKQSGMTDTDFVEKNDRRSPTPPSTQGNDDETSNRSKGVNPVKVVNGVAVMHGRTRSLVARFERREMLNIDVVHVPEKTSPLTPEPVETCTLLNNDQKDIAREEPIANDNNIIEDLMQDHDLLLSTFRSRLTKLQVVRHFWEKNDFKGAINAVRKLPDHSVQADVVGVFMERMEIITLDLFSCLLPMLSGLLGSKLERHASVSLEMLLKLVAAFGSQVHSTVSAPRAVGVDLHLEERRECCKQCFAHLQNIQRVLPELVRRGGVVAKCAQELNLVLLQT